MTIEEDISKIVGDKLDTPEPEKEKSDWAKVGEVLLGTPFSDTARVEDLPKWVMDAVEA